MPNILGTRIDNLELEQAILKVSSFLKSDTQHTIFTPNPEMLVLASKDRTFRDILNIGSLNVCDGFGIKLITFGKIIRIPGVDFMQDVAKLGTRVYLLGSGSQKVLDSVVQNLDAEIVGTHPGPILDESGNGDSREVIADIREKNPDILLVAFGHGKQEKWISQNLSELPSVKVAMGVGGSFDFISGKIKRSPKIVRKIGFEWLWRLIMQPWRVGRIWTAVVVFPLRYLLSKR